MSDSKEEVTKSGDAAVASEGGYLPSCGGGLSRNIWTFWRHDQPTKFGENWLEGMKRLEVVETHSDFLKVMVNITAPLEKPTKPLQYFFFKNTVMPMWEDYENIGGCRCTVYMAKKNAEAAQTLFINLCNMAISSQKSPVMENVNGIVFGYALKGFKVAVWVNKWMSLGGLNVLKDKLMQMTDGNQASSRRFEKRLQIGLISDFFSTLKTQYLCFFYQGEPYRGGFSSLKASSHRY
ncbi:Eukaryotic translation initiation factor 4E [Trichinella zimbabwensis]|uniref:Eukaryotic translation initiation factor 4E n=1 Tax=Trichinella zimbabwensis TaxID=268475 RepID=A0A0V1H1J5_9BILA|nr:Eukaryotic translation initiation factor 4E [Trichinella zimbabwensis]